MTDPQNAIQQSHEKCDLTFSCDHDHIAILIIAII